MLVRYDHLIGEAPNSIDRRRGAVGGYRQHYVVEAGFLVAGDVVEDLQDAARQRDALARLRGQRLVEAEGQAQRGLHGVGRAVRLLAQLAELASFVG